MEAKARKSTAVGGDRNALPRSEPLSESVAELSASEPRIGHYGGVLDSREKTFRAALAMFWVASNALVVVLALRSRDESASVQAVGGIVLVALTAVAPLVAVAAIRSRAILLLTLVVSGSLSLALSWSTMRDVSSTAPLGIIVTPTMTLALIVAGTAVDYFRRHAAQPISRRSR